jgi:hypothetical protein
LASKQRRPEHEPEQAESRATAEVAIGPAAGLGTERDLVPPVASSLARAPDLAQVGNPIAERITLALCVAPRSADATTHLVEVVDRSALPDGRKVEIRERLRADQAAADAVANAVVRAFGRDDADLRTALSEGARLATDLDLVTTIARHAGEPETSVRALCDELSGWVGWWWDEKEEEDASPGDYAAEESGA